MPSSTVENYLKQIYLEQQSPGQLVPMGRLAEAMDVAPGTATAMMKTLADSNLVVYEPRGGARLTPSGRTLALHVLRRHRLVELFLVQVLGLDWSEVHEEAEVLEHAISDKVLERIDGLLDCPQFDPHGDPIPTAKGRITQRQLDTLVGCPIHQRLRVAQVTDQDPLFLQFAHRRGLMPGVVLTVEQRDAAADAVTVRPEGQPALTIGTAAAAKIMVETAPGG